MILNLLKGLTRLTQSFTVGKGKEAERREVGD